jgi:hypothetical protein
MNIVGDDSIKLLPLLLLFVIVRFEYSYYLLKTFQKKVATWYIKISYFSKFLILSFLIYIYFSLSVIRHLFSFFLVRLIIDLKGHIPCHSLYISTTSPFLYLLASNIISTILSATSLGLSILFLLRS